MASGSVCSASGCNLYAGNSRGVSFFRFPRDPKRCKKWITNCRQKDLEHFLKRSSDYLYFNHKLCANHFDDSQFANKMRNRLVPDAVPTLFDVRDKMLDPPSKATTQKIASGDKVTHISGHATTAGQTIVVEPDGSSRAGKRKYPKDSSCVISRELLDDAKLMLTPAVVLERVKLPELQLKEIVESPCPQPEVVGPIKSETKTPVQREHVVKQLKQELQKLKEDLDKERTWHKNHESYVEMVRLKNQQKAEAIERERKIQLQKQTDSEAVVASPFWIKVEEASNAPDKKVYYVFSGVNGTSNPAAIAATKLPRSADRYQSEDVKTVLSTSMNSSHDANHRKSNEGQLLMPSTPGDNSKSSPGGNKKRKGSEARLERRKAENCAVLRVLTYRNGHVKYKCTKCRKCILGRKRLLQHLAELHSDMSYECNDCHASYRDKKQFIDHLDVHHNSQFTRHTKNDCHICGRHFNSRPSFEEHMACHAQNLYGCSACKASFVELGDLKRHLPCTLATTEMPAFLCLGCDEMFYTRLQIQRHVKCNHRLVPKIENDYEKCYSYIPKRKTRITYKFERKLYACETCGKNFRLFQAYVNHMPCTVKICKVCEMQFQNKARLNTHMKLCHNNQAVTCSLCGSRFISQYRLTAHEILYKGQCQRQLFVCNYCGHKTKYASGFTKHLQAHERKMMPDVSKKYSISVGTTVKLESDLQIRSSSISEKFPINAQTQLQLKSEYEILSSNVSNQGPNKLESDCGFLSSNISSKCSVNAQTMVECESDPEFLCVD